MAKFSVLGISIQRYFIGPTLYKLYRANIHGFGALDKVGHRLLVYMNQRDELILLIKKLVRVILSNC